MKNRRIPLRTCVVTKEQFPKNELLRVVRDNEGNVSVDETGRMNGRCLHRPGQPQNARQNL